MAQKEELDIHVLPNGEIKVDVKGARGKKCLSYMNIFEKVIGYVRTKNLKAEYYEPEPKTKIDLEGKQTH
jgi:hypothetical protein